MRYLTEGEIVRLEAQGCRAEDWQRVLVSDDGGFLADRVEGVRFFGEVWMGSLEGTMTIGEGMERPCGIRNATLRDVHVGDHCLIENVGGHIANYHIGPHCLVSHIGTMTAQEGTHYGVGQAISVPSEAGHPNIILHPQLTAQTAALMLKEPAVRRLYSSAPPATPPSGGRLGEGARLVGVREVVNTCIGDYAEITYASRVSESHIQRGALIGTDTIVEGCMVAEGAVVTDGAKAYRCFIGEGARLARGFCAENSLFFANCEMLGGEACAAFCGPCSCSHHKSSLLIGGEWAFYNAGSGTNFSNHAYKMGPLHHGRMLRGAKTASGAHVLWPATIGAFSMVMGKVENHPDTSLLPFSYVFGERGRTVVVPGIALRSVGTWRDVHKWPRRDRRDPAARHDLVQTAFPNPLLVQQALAGKALLQRLLNEQPQGEWLEHNAMAIKRTAAEAGIRYYDLAIQLFVEAAPQQPTTAPQIGKGAAWVDLCGMLAPEEEVERMARDVATGAIASIDELLDVLSQVHDQYEENAAEFRDQLQGQWDNSPLAEADQAHSLWLRMAQTDAEREFQLGDIDEDYLRQFIQSIQ